MNLMVAQIAKTVFEIPVVLARVFDPAREAIYREFDIETISPTQLSADLFLQKLNTHLSESNRRSESVDNSPLTAGK